MFKNHGPRRAVKLTMMTHFAVPSDSSEMYYTTQNPCPFARNDAFSTVTFTAA